MNSILNSLLTPAIIIASITLIIQGIFGVINTLMQIREGKSSRNANQISYVNSLLQLTDGLPLGEGTKTVIKIRIAKELLPDSLPQILIENIETGFVDNGG